MSAVVDSAQRQRAVNPAASFCVSAPAGSGKTELLIQRYLALLARVSRPEQVLAITFTRKAAGEMRERLLQALRDARDGTPCTGAHEQVTRDLALAALAAGERGNWQLLHHVSRLNIKTIDGYCLALTRQMPILSSIGGEAAPQEDATPLYEAAVRALYQLLDTDHAVAADLRAVLAHFDNNWDRLRELLISMLRRRSQWRAYVGVRDTPDESERYLVGAVEELVREHLSSLHDVLAPYGSELLDLLVFADTNRGETPMSAFPQPRPSELAHWRRLRDILLTGTGTWRKNFTVREGFPADKKGEAPERTARIKSIVSDLAGVPELEPLLADVATLPAIAAGDRSWQLVLHLSRLLPVLAAQLLLVFRRRGVVDYSQLAQSALQALGDDEAPTELALRIDYSLEHILVDEFQDTSIDQFDLLRKLTRGWGDYNAQNPKAPRTLFIVGDAMQSIYGFRDANVGLFIRARREGFNGVALEHLQLQSNFRSQAGVVEWVNHTFAAAFPEREDIGAAQVTYSPAIATRHAVDGAAVTLDAFCGDGAVAAEAEHICTQIARCVEAGERDIAVLGRQRSHLHPIGRGLKQKGVHYHAQDLDSLAHSPVVMDLLTLCRALSCRADRVSWLALLRAPWCGLTLADLLAVARLGEQSPHQPIAATLQSEALARQLSDDGRTRLAHVRRVMARAWAQRDRLGLRAWVERTWLDLGGARAAPDGLALADAERFMEMLEQAEAQGIGLDVAWLARQVDSQYTSGGDPDCPVQLLTLHKAKGLEFERVFIPRLNGTPRGDTGELLLWDERVDRAGKQVFLLAADDRADKTSPTLYNWLKSQRKAKTGLEATRLIYVGATRAIRHLHLSAGVRWDEKQDRPRQPPAQSLLATIWPDFEAGMTVHDAPVGDEVTAMPAQPLVRLPLEHLPVTVAAEQPPASEDVPERPDNHFERCVGTVVHLALEELSRRETLPDAASAADESRWRAALQEAGLWGDALHQALNTVLAAVATTLTPGGNGRWVLNRAHAHARSEWALTVHEGEGTRDLVIDRSFVERDTGVRWVIDYKTSRPAPQEAFDAFLARESDDYVEQLRRYRDALRCIGDEPLCCALYFTALGRLHVLEELSLPAGGI